MPTYIYYILYVIILVTFLTVILWNRKLRIANGINGNIGYLIGLLSLIWGLFAPFISSFPVWVSFVVLGLAIILIYLCLQLDSYNFKNKELKKQIVANKDELIGSYEELRNHERSKRYVQLFKEFCEDQSSVIAVQTYEYRLGTGKDLHDYTITLTYGEGYVDEGKDLNAILQAKYIFTKKNLQEAKSQYKKIKKPINIITSYQTIKGKIVELSKIITDSLQERIYMHDDILLFMVLNDKLGNKDDSLEDLIKTIPYYKRRTNVVKAIISYELFQDASYSVSGYTGHAPEKSGRKYFIRIARNKYGKKILFLVVVDSDDFADNVSSKKSDLAFEDKFNDFLNSKKILEERKENGK